tara:strand:+ start:8476 stop:8805 length:330 start_codon:yes stop_codon:yes gene_type:complete
MKPLMTFCSKTLAHFKLLIKNSKESALLIGIKGGGCNGYKYYIEPTSNTPEKRDELIKIDDLNIIICGKSLMHLLGTRIYWSDDVMGSRIEFDNPNAKSTCGCGDTFSL